MTIQCAAKLDISVSKSAGAELRNGKSSIDEAASLESASVVEALNRSFGSPKQPLDVTTRQTLQPVVMTAETTSVPKEKQPEQLQDSKKPELFDLSCPSHHEKKNVVTKTVVDCIQTYGTNRVSDWIMGPYIRDSMRASLFFVLNSTSHTEIDDSTTTPVAVDSSTKSSNTSGLVNMAMEEVTDCSVDGRELPTAYEALLCMEQQSMEIVEVKEEQTECSVDDRELSTDHEELRCVQSKAEPTNASASSWKSGFKSFLVETSTDGKSPKELIQHLESLAELSNLINDRVQKTVQALKASLA